MAISFFAQTDGRAVPSASVLFKSCAASGKNTRRIGDAISLDDHTPRREWRYSGEDCFEHFRRGQAINRDA